MHAKSIALVAVVCLLCNIVAVELDIAKPMMEIVDETANATTADRNPAKFHQASNWLKPLEDKLETLWTIVNHPNDQFGVNRLWEKIAQKAERLVSHVIHGVNRPVSGYPFPYSFKEQASRDTTP